MSENVDVNVLLATAPQGESRLELIGEFFTLMADWVGVPQTVAFHDLASGDFNEVPWSEALGRLTTGVPDGTLIHVYGTAFHASRSSLTIDEELPAAVYTLAMPRPILSGEPLMNVEEKLWRLYATASALSKAALIAGPELTVNLDASGFDQNVRRQLQDLSLTWFVILPPDLGRGSNDILTVVRDEPLGVGLRHRDIGVQLGA